MATALSLLFFHSLLDTAFLSLTIYSADDIIDAYITIFKHVAYDIVRGYVGYTEREVDMLSWRELATGAGSSSIYALAKDRVLADYTASAGIFG